jgi:N-acetylmuramoyl-L-alanine amidase
LEETTTTAPSPELSTTTTVAISTTTLEPAPLPEVTAVQTPTGVNVAVIDRQGARLIVRTPCGNSAEISSGQPLGKIAVVIDPGHGGPTDTGTIGANGLIERDLNLDVAEAIEAELLRRGISVALTRTADYPSPLEVRSAFADDLGAALMVSIHHNAPAPGPSDLPGTEVFIQSNSPQSERLGQLVWEYVRDGLTVFEDVTWSSALDVGVLRVLNARGTDAYGMVRNPETVSVLVELAYLNNPSEAELMVTPEYVEVSGMLVADAIEAYLTTEEQGSGYVTEPRVFNPQPGLSADRCEDPELE